MKLSTQILFLAALIALATFTNTAFAQQASNGAEVGPAIALNAPTRGVVFKTASINSDGTRAQSFRAVASIHLGVGTYQVTFDENVQALNGFSRWVQVDTLTTGSISGVSCTTADRAGNVRAVFILCTNAAGANVDTSFFLFVAR